MFESVLQLLGDGRYEPGEKLFRGLEEVCDWKWQDMYDRFYELMEEPRYKRKRFEITKEHSGTPWKSPTPVKKPETPSQVQDHAPDLGPFKPTALDFQEAGEEEADGEQESEAEGERAEVVSIQLIFFIILFSWSVC